MKGVIEGIIIAIVIVVIFVFGAYEGSKAQKSIAKDFVISNQFAYYACNSTNGTTHLEWDTNKVVYIPKWIK